MDSWSYVSEEKDLLFSHDALSSPKTFSRSKNSILGWDLKTPSSFATDMSASGQQNIENQDYQELGFPEMSGKQLSEGRIINPVMTAGDDSTNNSKLSSSVVEPNGRDSLIDLKLGRFADHRDGHDSSFSKNAPAVSSSAPAKRMRASAVQSQTAYCQVYGCNKDLSASKDYHKRHRVCEVHSKTAKVIVSGIEQRFCQQCSRFHLLAEFDDGKRSCRKRLAGHNERRRKPQMGILTRKSGSFLQPFGGVLADSRLLGTMLTTTSSFICQDVLQSKDLVLGKYGTNDWWRHIKMEDGTHQYRNLSGLPVTNGHVESSSSSLFPSDNLQKQFPFLHENGTTTTAARSLFSDNTNDQYPPPLFQDINLGSEDFNVFNTATTFQGLSGISDSGTGRALSLLSSQSQNSSSYSSGVPLAARPAVVPSSHSHYSCNNQVSGKIIGISSQSSASRVSENFPILISDSNDIENFEMADGIFQGWDFLNMKNSLSCGDGQTVDMLQLSSQLQQVEHQRQSIQVKQENDCSLQIT